MKFMSFHTNDCLSVSVPKAVQIVAVGRVHAILHHTSQFPLPCPGEISLKHTFVHVFVKYTVFYFIIFAVLMS